MSGERWSDRVGDDVEAGVAADLEEKAAYYLARPQVLERIAGAAQRLVHEALTEKWFLDRYREVIVSALAQRPRRTVALSQLSTTLDSRRR